MNISTEQLLLWKDQQNAMKNHVIKIDPTDNFYEKIKYVGGVDISFNKKDPNNCCIYLIVLDFNTLSVVYEDHIIKTLTIPYVSGFLGFREVVHYEYLIDKLKKSNPELVPDIILVDGFGTLHERGYGSASQLGVECLIPTIGSAKTLMCIDGLNEKEIK